MSVDPVRPNIVKFLKEMQLREEEKQKRKELMQKAAVPALGFANIAMNKFSEYLRKKDINEEYRRMQTLSSIPSTTVLTDMGQYGNPYVMELGGIPDLSAETVLPAVPLPEIPQQTKVSNFNTNFSFSNPSSFDWSSSDNSFRQKIIMKESAGDYRALPFKKDGKLASSAVGAYQFLWNYHKDAIRKVTGVKTKEEFRNNPEAQDMYFDYWDANVLTPTAMLIKRVLGERAPDINTIKAKVHFAGPKGAKDYYFRGIETKDAFGTTTSKYKEGGEYDMSPEEILEFMKLGGELEFI